MSNPFNFDRVKQNIERIKRTLPILLANDAKEYFLASFKAQGWDGQSWQSVKRQGKKGSSRNNSAILVQSGRLRLSVANSIKLVSWDKIILRIDGNEVPYAKVHNDGLRAGRGAGFIMPKRHFFGDSPFLRLKQRNHINDAIDKIWQG